MGYGPADGRAVARVSDDRPATPRPAQEPCAHPDFEARVAVNRIEDTKRFSADVRIWCLACGEPFRFVGVNAGLSPYGPRVSVDGLELRTPIKPTGRGQLAARATFEVAPKES